MSGQSAETVDHLTGHGVQAIEELVQNEPAIQDLDTSKLKFTETTAPREVPEPNSPEVWSMKTATDHMVTVTWTDDAGWHAPEIKPYGPFTMMPIASCLHYATQCFEGMKVYRGYDEKLRLFRPERNAARLAMSSARVALPSFNTEEFVKLLKEFMKVDGPKWLPKSRPGTFFYVRPAIIGNGEQIGVLAPSEILMFIVMVAWPELGSVTARSSTAKQPGLKLLASKNDTRAWPGGFGYAKVGANYGPALVSHMEARKRGYDQILWLLGSDFLVTEAGASNFFVVWKTKEGNFELITAPLDDKVILEGVTRQSVLDLARERFVEGSKHLPSELKGLTVVERKYTMLEVEEAHKEGRIVEVFLSGTAYFITPINAINFRDQELEMPMGDGTSGYYAALLKKWLGDIMYGNVSHPWGVVVEGA